MASKAMPSWADLNERQQQYLQAIYETDHEHEADELGMWKPRHGWFTDPGNDADRHASDDGIALADLWALI